MVVKLRPRAINATNNSLALILRDNILTVLKTNPFFVNFKLFQTTKQFQLMRDNLPFLGVYLVGESAGPDGDWDAGPPKFTVDARIGFSVWLINQDPVETELQLDGAFRAIMNALLCYPTVYNDKVAPVEGFSRYTRTHHYGSPGLNNELPAAEMRLELTCKFREYYEFVATDDFKLLHFETAYPTPEEGTKVQQVEAVWDIPQYVAPPDVTGISPNVGPIAGGTSITITGTGFTGASGVSFDSTAAASFSVVSDTSITATSPVVSAAGVVDVTVTNSAGTSEVSSSDLFTYQ